LDGRSSSSTDRSSEPTWVLQSQRPSKRRRISGRTSDCDPDLLYMTGARHAATDLELFGITVTNAPVRNRLFQDGPTGRNPGEQSRPRPRNRRINWDCRVEWYNYRTHGLSIQIFPSRRPCCVRPQLRRHSPFPEKHEHLLRSTTGSTWGPVHERNWQPSQ